MAVKMRLVRVGGNKKPFYRIVAIDERKPRNSEYLEKIGYYDPTKDPIVCEINEELAIKHLNTGAIPSPKVRGLLSKAGILKKVHEAKYAKKTS